MTTTPASCHPSPLQLSRLQASIKLIHPPKPFNLQPPGCPASLRLAASSAAATMASTAGSFAPTWLLPTGSFRASRTTCMTYSCCHMPRPTARAPSPLLVLSPEAAEVLQRRLPRACRRLQRHPPAYQDVRRACSSCCCMVPEPLLRRPITIDPVIVISSAASPAAAAAVAVVAASCCFPHLQRRLPRHCHRCHECCAAQLLLQHCPRAVAKPSPGPVLLHNSSCPAAALASASPPAPPVVSEVHWLLCSSQHLR
jgi:hypothetical protein